MVGIVSQVPGPGEPATRGTLHGSGHQPATVDRPVTRVTRVMAGYPWVPPGTMQGEPPCDISKVRHNILKSYRNSGLQASVTIIH